MNSEWVKIAKPRPPLVGFRDAAEITLGGIWADSLGLPTVTRDSNFFELGGSSFQAVSIIAAVQHRLGITLPIGSIMERPTVASFAELIRTGPTEEQRACLVPFRFRGTGSPIYCFHPLAGTVIRYAALGMSIDKDIPVYGVQAYGLDPRHEPHRTIEEMAQEYITEMLEVQPDGPFHLLGYSIGGTIAFEVARQLRQRGSDVGILAMVDTYTTESDEVTVDDAIYRLMWKGLRLAVRPANFMQLDQDEQIAALLRLGIEAGSIPADFEEAHVRRMFEMYYINDAACRAYTLEYAAERIVLFRGDDPGAPTLGWERYVDEVEAISVPGDHHAMMEPQGAAVIGRVLSRMIKSQ
jgi:thioesterase domain-containing protein/acyl carrier protein